MLDLSLLGWYLAMGTHSFLPPSLKESQLQAHPTPKMLLDGRFHKDVSLEFETQAEPKGGSSFCN